MTEGTSRTTEHVFIGGSLDGQIRHVDESAPRFRAVPIAGYFGVSEYRPLQLYDGGRQFVTVYVDTRLSPREALERLLEWYRPECCCQDPKR